MARITKLKFGRFI